MSGHFRAEEALSLFVKVIKLSYTLLTQQPSSQILRHMKIAILLLLTLALCSHTTLAQDRKTPPNPNAILASAKVIFVRSTSVLVGKEVIETKLRKRSEFQALGLVITRDELEADLILEVRHDVFTKYVYTAIDPRTQIVVASGKLSSLGGTVAGKVAKRFMKELINSPCNGGALISDFIAV